MREISAQQIADTVRRLCIEANRSLPGDVRRRIQDCRAAEDRPVARAVPSRFMG